MTQQLWHRSRPSRIKSILTLILCLSIACAESLTSRWRQRRYFGVLRPRLVVTQNSPAWVLVSAGTFRHNPT